MLELLQKNQLNKSQAEYCGEVSHKESVAENNDDQRSLNDDSSQVIERIEINKIKNLPLQRNSPHYFRLRPLYIFDGVIVILVNLVHEIFIYSSQLLYFGVWNDVVFIWGGRHVDVKV